MFAGGLLLVRDVHVRVAHVEVALRGRRVGSSCRRQPQEPRVSWRPAAPLTQRTSSILAFYLEDISTVSSTRKMTAWRCVPYWEIAQCTVFSAKMFGVSHLHTPLDLERLSSPLCPFRLGLFNLHHIKKSLVVLTSQETAAYPTHLLDLMVMCWSHDQCERPSAREITQIASSPAFSHLKDVTSLEGQVEVIAAASSPIVLETDSDFNGGECE